MNNRGILKNNQNSPKEQKKLKWDETSLTLTDLQKNSTMKITEPKTPFIYSNNLTDTENEDSCEEFKLPNTITTDPPLHKPTNQITNSTSDSNLKETVAKVDQSTFKQFREEHYKMKEALAKGKELLKEEDA